MDTKEFVSKNVDNLYDLTGITPEVNISDYTEGIFNGNPDIPHNVAQKNQHLYLLKEIGACKGFRLLEIGCGLGTLLETAREMGVKGVGITISSDQVRQCRNKGLDVRLHNYKNLPKELNGRFDGIIANGSIEHFCQPKEVLRGEQDNIYRKMFEIFSRLLDSHSNHQKIATTVIHFRGERVDPKKILKSPFFQIFDAEGFYSSILHRGYGGYYPVTGQLESCAEKFFELEKSVDGTEDYRITSEHWCHEYKKGLYKNFNFVFQLLKHFSKKPLHTLYVAASYVGPESWPWQFRGKSPRTVLYRQTWKRISV